jgi:ABC-type branched-subunit amino acid transport system ATPase component
MSKILTSTRSFSNFVTTSPRYIIEFVIIFFSISAIIIVFKNTEFKEESVLFLFFFGILSIKIVPLLQAIYISVATMQSNKSLVDKLSEIKFIKSKKQKKINHFSKNIELKNISYKYEKEKSILLNLNLKINKGDTIAITGSNGAGKSTLINILSGLVKPSSGKIYCDNSLVLDKNLYGLFSILDPSPIFLNSNIYENICFKENISLNDKKEIRKLLKLVELSPKNLMRYNSDNLEAKFSQGEKQKIALARFLYFKKEFLIIDEGTTNLGSDLELNLLKKIKKIYPTLTIVFISHRFNNLSFFNYIYEIKNQKLHKLKSYN